MDTPAADEMQGEDLDPLSLKVVHKIAVGWADFPAVLGLLTLVYVAGMIVSPPWQGLAQCVAAALATWRVIHVVHMAGRQKIVIASMAVTAVGVSLLGAVVASREHSGALSAGILVLLFLMLMLIVLRHVFRAPVVDVNVIFGALCVYVLLGLMFANLYLVIQETTGTDFFTQGRGTQAELLYFSFVTETTLGYGDFTAQSDMGRALAVMEALMGQILLVTLVARFVGALGSSRHALLEQAARRSAGEAGGGSPASPGLVDADEAATGETESQG